MLRKIENRYVFALAFLAIMLVPIGINYLVSIENNYFSIFGSDHDWFLFWSSYSGAAISGLITLIVLYKTLKQNQSNHIDQKNYSDKLNREQKSFQLKLIETQNKQRWLDELKVKLKEDIEILDFSNIENLTNRISIVESNIELMNDLSNYERKVKNTKLSLKILYQDRFDSKPCESYKKSSDNLANQLLKVIKAFSDYLVILEQAIVETKFRMDNVKNVEKMELTKLAILREKGHRDFSEKRKNLRDRIRNHKPEIDLISEIMQISMIELIKYEERNIIKGF